MEKKEFAEYFRTLLEAKTFDKLLQTPVSSDPEALAYTESRRIPPNDIFSFTGDFKYKGSHYKLSKSIVIPLRDMQGFVRGVWIRAIQEKKFYIWMAGNLQKYWIPKDFDPSKRVIICESILDAMSLSKLIGYSNVMAALGVAPTKEIQNILTGEVILALDNDTAGKKSALTLLTSNPSWGIIETSEGFKDYNEALVKNLRPNFKILYGIQARIHLKSLL